MNARTLRVAEAETKPLTLYARARRDKSAEELLTTFEERPFATVACILTRATQYHVPTFAEFFFEMTREWRKDFFNRTALDAVAVARYAI